MAETLTQADRVELARAQRLQVRREQWKASLDAVPCEKANATEFPYATMDEAIADGFLKVGGEDGMLKLAAKAWKTKQWRAAAERNRKLRDAMAEESGDVSAETGE